MCWALPAAFYLPTMFPNIRRTIPWRALYIGLVQPRRPSPQEPFGFFFSFETTKPFSIPFSGQLIFASIKNCIPFVSFPLNRSAHNSSPHLRNKYIHLEKFFKIGNLDNHQTFHIPVINASVCCPLP